MSRAQLNLLDEMIVDNFAGGGASTTRKRFFLIARCDGWPIMWPEPTHAPADSPGVRAGTKKPWRSAAEIIDWTLPCPSIFDTREQVREKYGLNAVRPLADNTMQRVARGVDKFVIKTANPFLVIVNHAGEFRGQGLGEPLQTITAKHGYGVAAPVMAPATLTNTTGSAGAPASDPVHTITSAGNQAMTKDVLAPLTMHNNENAVGTSITAPVNTITGSGAGGHQMLITPTLAAIGQTGGCVCLWEIDPQTNGPAGIPELFGDWDAAHYLARAMELLHPNRKINVPDLAAMVRAATKDGVDVCDYCQECDCRDCIVNEWKCSASGE